MGTDELAKVLIEAAKIRVVDSQFESPARVG
jgi:hypothetical protein